MARELPRELRFRRYGALRRAREEHGGPGAAYEDLPKSTMFHAWRQARPAVARKQARDRSAQSGQATTLHLTRTRHIAPATRRQAVRLDGRHISPFEFAPASAPNQRDAMQGAHGGSVRRRSRAKGHWRAATTALGPHRSRRSCGMLVRCAPENISCSSTRSRSARSTTHPARSGAARPDQPGGAPRRLAPALPRAGRSLDATHPDAPSDSGTRGTRR